MEFAPDRLYLTHYGEIDEPAAKLESYCQWIDQYVDLGLQFDPGSTGFEANLEQALGRLIMQNVCNGPDADMQRLLQNDITLNAQGLAHWRTRNANA